VLKLFKKKGRLLVHFHLSSLHFAISKRKSYKRANDVHADTVHLLAVLDDATVIGPAQHAIDCVAELHKDTQDHGQEFN